MSEVTPYLQQHEAHKSRDQMKGRTVRRCQSQRRCASTAPPCGCQVRRLWAHARHRTCSTASRVELQEAGKGRDSLGVVVRVSVAVNQMLKHLEPVGGGSRHASDRGCVRSSVGGGGCRGRLD